MGQKCIRIITIQSNGDKKRFGHRKIIYEVNGQIGHGKCVTTAKLFTIQPFLIIKFDCNTYKKSEIKI